MNKGVLGSMAKPTNFQISISNCGMNTLNGSYKLLKHINPILLGLKVTDIMANDFAGKEYSPYFKYYLACAMLKELEFDKKKLFKDIDNIKDKIKELDLKVEEKKK